MKRMPIWEGIVIFEQTIYGEPIAQPRARVALRGKHIHAYTPSKHPINGWKDTLRLTAQKWVTDGGKMIARPSSVEIMLDFYFLPPQCMKLKETAEHTKKPDLDNLIKAVTDALNGVVYEDDSQISCIYAEKLYTPGNDPRVEILITGDAK